jgi:hypothetical protein
MKYSATGAFKALFMVFSMADGTRTKGPEEAYSCQVASLMRQIGILYTSFHDL